MHWDHHITQEDSDEVTANWSGCPENEVHLKQICFNMLVIVPNYIQIYLDIIDILSTKELIGRSYTRLTIAV